MDEPGGCHLLLEFTNVECIGSLESGLLVTLHKRMQASGGRLTLFNLNAHVVEVFTVARLQTLLAISGRRRRHRKPGAARRWRQDGGEV